MPDENPQVGNPGQETPGQTTEPTQTAEQIKAARKAALEKLEVEAARTQTQAPKTEQEDEDGDPVDLSGLDPEVARRLRKKLAAADKKSTHVDTLARYGIEQARKVKVLELAQEFKLEPDELAPLERALANAWTPEAVDLGARELAIKLRADGSVFVQPAAAPKGKTQASTENEQTLAPVDTGRGGGSNRVAAFVEKVDEIDPYGDPAKNAEALEKLKKDADAAQQRFLQRAASR